MFSLLQDSVRFLRKYCVYTNLVPLNSSSHFPRPYQDKYWLLNTIAWNMKRSMPADEWQILCCTFRLILVLRLHNGIPEVHLGPQVFGAVPRLSTIIPVWKTCGVAALSSSTCITFWMLFRFVVNPTVKDFDRIWFILKRCNTSSPPPPLNQWQIWQ